MPLRSTAKRRCFYCLKKQVNVTAVAAGGLSFQKAIHPNPFHQNKKEVAKMQIRVNKIDYYKPYVNIVILSSTSGVNA